MHFGKVFKFVIFWAALNQQCNVECKHKKEPPMMGEPLTPGDYEKGFRLTLNAKIDKDLTIDDGTTNDIIKRKIKPQQTRGMETDDVKPWPNGIVYYMLDSQFTESDRASVAKAIQLIESKTCVKIIPRTSEENYVVLIKNTKSYGCSSYLGFMGGKQVMNLAERCIQRVGSTVHEFLHTLGFYHEQKRRDRDDYIIVHYENIKEGLADQFNKEPNNIPNLISHYDMHSIIHYTSYADSKNGKRTMDPKEGTGPLGQRQRLTDLDITKINKFYGCSGGNTRSMDIPGIFGIGSGGGGDDGSEKLTDSPTQATEAPSAAFNISSLNPLAACKDFDPPNCSVWAKYGHCKKGAIFMSVFCKSTCKKCDMGCLDMNKSCRKWAKKNYCKQFSHYMNYYCPLSCKRCLKPK